MEALEDTWRNLQKIIQERDDELKREHARQEQNDQLRQEFASVANNFHHWLQVSFFFCLPTQSLLFPQINRFLHPSLP